MKLFVGAKGIVHRGGKILLLRESKEYGDGCEAGRWDVPGGRIESGEMVRDGLKREVEEESGLDVRPGHILGIFDGFPEIQGEKCHVIRVYFLCEAKSGDVVLSDDHDAFDWVDPNDVADKDLMDDIEEMLKASRVFI
jgi:8-oxo-dGTP diphosphatase